MGKGLSFLNTKSWHTKSISVQERVWLAEEKEKERQKREKEREEELKKEREEEYHAAVRRNHRNTDQYSKHGLAFMYKQPEVVHELLKREEETNANATNQRTNANGSADDNHSNLNDSHKGKPTNNSKSSSSSSSLATSSSNNAKNDTPQHRSQDAMYHDPLIDMMKSKYRSTSSKHSTMNSIEGIVGHSANDRSELHTYVISDDENDDVTTTYVKHEERNSSNTASNNRYSASDTADADINSMTEEEMLQYLQRLKAERKQLKSATKHKQKHRNRDHVDDDDDSVSNNSSSSHDYNHNQHTRKRSKR